MLCRENTFRFVKLPSLHIPTAPPTGTTSCYNGDGLKVFEDDGVEQTLYVYDGNNLLQEQSVYGTVAEFTYVPAPYAQALSQRREGYSSFFHGDGMSNATVLTDSWQIITDEYTYDAWGKKSSWLHHGICLSFERDRRYDI